MLHDAMRHEPLSALPWDESQARTAIEAIATEVEARFVPGQGWPLHPLDRESADESDGATALYYGASGVIWGLQHLCSLDVATLQHDYRLELGSLLCRHRAWLDANGLHEPSSFLMGETPILMMLHASEPAAWIDTALTRRIEDNADHPSRELMWGAPGTLLAALLLHERTGEAHWADLFRRTADSLWQAWRYAEAAGCQYIPQQLYGHAASYLGAVHGLVGLALPLARGQALLEVATWNAWRDRLLDTVHRTAVHESGGVNWWPQLLEPKPGRKQLMQICHGAPGFVVCLAGMADASLDTLLCKAGEAVWRAGPVGKGSNLCHGTAGNGYALLKLFERTGDSMWLERARSFAMHAMEQQQRALEQHDQPRCSLWTGDVGLAIFLADCLRAEAQFPSLDVF